MELSGKLEYAVLALLELSTHYPSGEPLQIRQIAALQNIPQRYLEQILAALRRGGLIKSVLGKYGGYILARSPTDITLLDAASCMEGLGSTTFAQSATAKTVEISIVIEIWQQAERAATSVLQQYTLQRLCDLLTARQQVGLMYYI
jgi:Rrf2 family protein